jgi:hypothetical protein
MADPLDKRYAKYKEPFMKPVRTDCVLFLDSPAKLVPLTDIGRRSRSRERPWTKSEVSFGFVSNLREIS